MITLHTRVLNGLPIRVEAETANDQFEGLIVEDIQLFWTKKSREGYIRAGVIERKMSHNDWDLLEEEILDVVCGRCSLAEDLWIG